MRLFVTGANGFVGRALVARAADAGWAVRAGMRRPEAEPTRPGAIETVKFDLENPDLSEELRGVDAVVHLAARVHMLRDPADDPVSEYRRVNVGGTKRLAVAAARAGVRRFVFVSSIKVNGSEREEPYKEDDAPAPADAYGRSKLEAERALASISAETGLEVVVVRPPLVYGPGVRANFLAMMRAVDRGLPLPFRSVRNRRSLVYVGNLADALMRCTAEPRAGGRTYLVSDGADLSTPELLRSLGSALGRPARLWSAPRWVFTAATHVPRIGPAVRRLAGSLALDSSRVQAELRWIPPYSTSDGLRATADWYRRCGS